MAYWKKVDKNGNIIQAEPGVNQDRQPFPDYIEANWQAGKSLYGPPQDTPVNNKEDESVKSAIRYARLSPQEQERERTEQVRTGEAQAAAQLSITGMPLPPQPYEELNVLRPLIKDKDGNSFESYTMPNGGGEIWRIARGTAYRQPTPAKTGGTSTSSFSTSEVGPVTAALRREEAAAAVTAAALKVQTDAAAATVAAEARLRVDNAAILRGQQEIAIAQRAASLNENKDAYARSVDNVKLQREAQTALFSQQADIARLQTEQVGLIARRDESQAQLDQAVNLANLSAEQRGQEFNVTQEFNVQRANEEAARARQQQLQTLGTDIGKLGADSGDRGQYAATILANSGWGQADRALAGTNMNTTASLSPLESLLRQRETVQNLSDKPYTYKATTIPTAARTQMAPVDFSRVNIPTPQTLAAFTPAPAFDPKSVTDMPTPTPGWTPPTPQPGQIASVGPRTQAETVAVAADKGNPLSGFAQMALKQGTTLGTVNAYGTKGTKEREFITGDPQRNGKPNPELVRVNNPGPNTRVEVIPLQGNGDMNMTSKYADGTDTGFAAADGRKRNSLEILQMLLNSGVAADAAMSMVKALNMDKQEEKAEPMPTGPEALFTEGATEGNPRAKVSPKRGVDEGDTGGVRTNKDEGDTGGVRTDRDYQNQFKQPGYKIRGADAAGRMGGLVEDAGMGLLDVVGAPANAVREGSAYLYGMTPGSYERGMGNDQSEWDKANPRRRNRAGYAYGTEGEGAEGAGDGVNVIMAALQNNPAALAAFMAMIGQGQEAPSFPA